jgi:hypothetical protein
MIELATAAVIAKLASDAVSLKDALALEPSALQTASIDSDEGLVASMDSAAENGRRCRALSVLIPHLPPRKKRSVLISAVRSALSIQVSAMYARAVSQLAPLLPTNLAVTLLPRLPNVGTETIVRALIPRLSGHDLWKAAEAALLVEDERNQIGVLAELLDRKPFDKKRLLHLLKERARALADPDKRSSALALIALKLGSDQEKELLNEALSVARHGKDKKFLALGLGVLMRRSTLDAQKAILNEALEAARKIGNDETSIRTLIALGHDAPESEQHVVFEEVVASSMEVSFDLRADLLGLAAPDLPSDRLTTALHATRHIGDQEDVARAFASLTSHRRPSTTTRSKRISSTASRRPPSPQTSRRGGRWPAPGMHVQTRVQAGRNSGCPNRRCTPRRDPPGRISLTDCAGMWTTTSQVFSKFGKGRTASAIGPAARKPLRPVAQSWSLSRARPSRSASLSTT